MPTSAGYGYGGRLDAIRASEYGYNTGAYLDNAAAPLYAKSIATRWAAYLCEHPVINPHSRSSLAARTSSMIDSVRERVLDLFNADPEEYSVVFTAGATAGAKLVGEAMQDTAYVYLRDSHTSLVGLRALATKFSCVDTIENLDPGCVVSWPMQSNFTGYRYPTAPWLERVEAAGAISLLDMASFCSTALPNLCEIKPDLAVVSFYKIFGLPDLGALLVRRTPKVIMFLSQRKYAGGGTVAVVTPSVNFMVRSSDLSTSLEDGTLPFHNIACLAVAMDVFADIYGSFDVISTHVASLTAYCLDKLDETGACEILSPRGHGHGPIVTFVLKCAGYSEFDEVASKLGIQLRTGTLCNTGAFTVVTDMGDEQIIANYEVHGKTCNDGTDLLDGHHTGVIRVSFGPYSSFEDVDALISCIVTYFGVSATYSSLYSRHKPIVVEKLITYPIKSCAGVSLDCASIDASGIQWDREFCLVNPHTLNVLSLKNHHSMALIVPEVRELENVLAISFKGDQLTVPLNAADWHYGTRVLKVTGCVAPVQPELIVNKDEKVVEFFTRVLGCQCTLAKMTDSDDRHMKQDAHASLANSSPLLLISQASAQALGDVDAAVFRANIVISNAEPYQEDTWKVARIGSGQYALQGGCRRCNMVCVTPDGKSDASPYLALAKTRRINGKLYFGQHMRLEPSSSQAQICVGDVVTGDM